MIPTVIIPVYNRYDKLARCVESLDVPVGNLLIINNGTGVVDVPTRAENQHVLNMPCNLGVAPAWNLGIKCFPYSPGWVMLNSDAWFEPGAAEMFASQFDRKKIVLAGDPGWCCAWIGDQVVYEIGMFSECFLPAYYEDWDFERRAKASGFEVVASGAQINHDNASTIRSDERLLEMHKVRFKINTDLYHERWADGVPSEGVWALGRRRKMGWDAP